MSALKKGAWRKENPADGPRQAKTLGKLRSEELSIFDRLRSIEESSGETSAQLLEFLPGFYQNLRGMKNIGDKKMNEILLK